MDKLIERLIAGPHMMVGKCGHHYNSYCNSCRDALEITNNELRDLRAALKTLTRENAKARREVLGLIESIWKNEFRNEAPEWKPLSYLVGMITQLDNMYAGVRSQRDEARAERDAALAEVERLNAGWAKANADNLALGLQLTTTQARLEEAVGLINKAHIILGNCEVSAGFCDCGSQANQHTCGSETGVDVGGVYVAEWKSKYFASLAKQETSNA